MWSATPGTTDPLAPFGVVTLASSGAEGADAAMGAMRIAQTAGYGVLPSPDLPNTFLAQAYDLDDPWGPAVGPCFDSKEQGGWECCDKGGKPVAPIPEPPAPSPPSGAVACTGPDGWLNQTAFDPKTYSVVQYGSSGWVNVSSPNHFNGTAQCCAICSSAALQKLPQPCRYWEYYQDRSGPQHARCLLKATLGNYSARGAYSKWVTAGAIRPFGPPPPPPPLVCSAENRAKCAPACAAAMDTPVAMGGIHPRSKKPVGDRLGTAAYSVAYGGKAAGTGPTLSGCTLAGGKLTVFFNATLLAGDKVVLQKWGKGTPNKFGTVGGSYLDVQTDPAAFCMETARTADGERYCPTWAGGSGKPTNASYDSGWVQGLDFTLGTDGASIEADLAPLNGTAPSAVRYAWSIVNCCDMNDPGLYVTKPCGPASCPIMSSSNLPANPFMAKIVDGHCECIAPQVCGSA